MNSDSMHMDKRLSSKVLMIGDYAGPDATGGMASVIQSYRCCIPELNYIHSWRPSSSRIYKLLILLKACAVVICKLSFDRKIKIVHIHTCSGDSFWRSAWFVNLAKMYGKKIVLHMHGGRFKEFYEESSRKDRITSVIARSDRFVVLTQMWKSWFESIGVREESLRVLNNIVMPPLHTEVPDSDGKLHLLFLGTVIKEKGIYDLMDTIIRNKEEWKDRVVLKIGGELKDGQLMRMIEDNGLEPMVEYCGYVTGKNKIDILDWCDVFVLPSYFEGLPVSVLEAMSHSKAIIAARVGGIPSVVKDNENGILVEPGDMDALSAAVGAFLREPQLVSSYGRQGSLIARDYMPGKVIEDLAGIYLSLM